MFCPGFLGPAKTNTMEKTQDPSEKKEKSAFMKWLMEDDAPEIGFATKEPLSDYLRGVKSEFKKIDWPSKEQIKS